MDPRHNKGQGDVVNDISTLADYLRYGSLQDVIHEDYIPNPVGTPPEAALPSGIGLGPYGPGSLIPAP